MRPGAEFSAHGPGRIGTLVALAEVSAGSRTVADLVAGVAPLVLRAVGAHSAEVLRRRPSSAGEPLESGAPAEGPNRLSAELHLDGAVWGWLVVERDAGSPPFDLDELPFLRVLATLVSAGVTQAEYTERVNRLAYLDGLTGLANRRAFDEALDVALARGAEHGSAVGLVLCDVNGLKRLNDEEGHDAGDRMLLALAGQLSAAAAALPGSVVARLGGDEFAVLTVGYPCSEVVEMACALVARAWGRHGAAGVSCGVACTDEAIGALGSSRRLFRLADAALYRAKRSGAQTPVVAGREVPAAAEESATRRDPMATSSATSSADSSAGTPDDDRRRRLGRRAGDLGRALEAVLEVLDATPSRTPLARLDAVADTVTRTTDAAAFIISWHPLGTDYVETVASSCYRHPVGEDHEDALHRPPRSVTTPGTRFLLREYPETARILAGGYLGLDVGQPGNDPAEEALLVAGGYTGLVAAGASTAHGSWLVEVCGDELGRPVAGLGPALRCLMGVALLESVDPSASDGGQQTRSVPA